METVKRNWLRKQVELGKVEAKCNFHFTDDYAYDNASGFGKTEWMPARIRKPKFEEVTLYNGNKITTCTDSDHKDGFMNFTDFEFTSKGGRAYKDESGVITLRVHSNLVYTLRINN